MSFEGSYKIPRGWVWTRLGEVAELLRGVSYAKRESSKKPQDNYLPILRANNIDAKLNLIDLVYVPRQRIKNEQLIRASDILIAMSSGSRDLVGKTAQASHDFQGAFGAFCGLLRATTELDRKYMGLFFQSPTYRERIASLSSGININNLRREHIESTAIPIPPFAEQHRIVARIEELFTKLDAGVAALKKVKAQLKRYRQAVLKYAFAGKLTEEWRQTHKNELEPAAVLLERIKEERKKAAKVKLKELPPPDTSVLPEIPEGWVWTRVGEIYDIVGGGTPSTTVTDYWDGDIPWITSADIHGLRDIRPRRKINGKAIENSATNLIPENSLIVVTRVGLGKIALTKVPLCFSQDSQALVGNNFFINSNYSLYYLSKAIQIFKYKHRGTTIAGVPKSQLASLLFILPPLPEQHKIVEEIERRFSIADEVEKIVEQSLKQAERLRMSILKRAFEGKLVPQDPDDEPAEKLLERIKNARDQKFKPIKSDEYRKRIK